MIGEGCGWWVWSWFHLQELYVYNGGSFFNSLEYII